MVDDAAILIPPPLPSAMTFSGQDTFGKSNPFFQELNKYSARINKSAFPADLLCPQGTTYQR
jgi:hypothetical protein